LGPQEFIDLVKCPLSRDDFLDLLCQRNKL
jgi:hypothetical protein